MGGWGDRPGLHVAGGSEKLTSQTHPCLISPRSMPPTQFLPHLISLNLSPILSMSLRSCGCTYTGLLLARFQLWETMLELEDVKREYLVAARVENQR